MAELKPVIVPQAPSGEGGLLGWSRDIVFFLTQTLQQSGMEFDSQTVTLAAGAGPQTVSDLNVTSDSRIVMFPTNSAAAQLMGVNVTAGGAGVVQRIQVFTSSTAHTATADSFVPVDGASSSASYTPAAVGNDILFIYLGGAIEIETGAGAVLDVMGLRPVYGASSGTQSAFFDLLGADPGGPPDHRMTLPAACGAYFAAVTTAGPDIVRIQTISIAGSPLFLVGTNRVLIVIEFDNSAGGGGGGGQTGDIYVDNKTVADGSFRINWTGAAAGTETFDYIIMHKRGL
jgi:hypothetical protein